MRNYQTIRLLIITAMLVGAADVFSADKGSSMPLTHIAPAPEKDDAPPPSGQGMIMTHIDPNLVEPNDADTPQVEPVEIPAHDAGAGAGAAPAVEQIDVPEPEAVENFRAPDHLMDDMGRVGEVGEAGRAIPDGQVQDSIRELFGAADAAETGKGQGSKLGDFMGDVEMGGFGVPGQDDAADAAASSASELKGKGTRATGTRAFSPTGQRIIRNRISQLEVGGWSVVTTPSDDAGNLTGHFNRGSTPTALDSISRGYGFYNEETGEFMRVEVVETYERGTRDVRSVFVQNVSYGDPKDDGSRDVTGSEYNRYDGQGNHTGSSFGGGDPLKPGSGDTSSSGTDTGKPSKPADKPATASNDTSGKDTSSDSGSSGSSSDDDDTTSDSGDTGDTSSADTGGKDTAGNEGKDAVVDKGTKGYVGTGMGNTGGGDPRGGDTPAGTPADLPGLSQGGEIITIVDLSKEQIIDSDDLVTDPPDDANEGGGGGTITAPPVSIGPGANPGEATDDNKAPGMRIDPDVFVTDPLPEDVISNPVGE